MSEAELKKIFELSSKAWKKYKDDWCTVAPELRNDRFWDKITRDIRDMVKEAPDDHKQFFTDVLNAYAGQLNYDYQKTFTQEDLKL